MIKFFHNDWDETGLKILKAQNHNLDHWVCDKYFVSMLNEEVFHLAMITSEPENSCELKSIANWRPVLDSGLDKEQRRTLRNMHIYRTFRWIFETLEYDSVFSFIKEGEPKVRRILIDINGGAAGTTETTTNQGVSLLRWCYTKKEFETGILYENMQKSIHNF